MNKTPEELIIWWEKDNLHEILDRFLFILTLS